MPQKLRRRRQTLRQFTADRASRKYVQCVESAGRVDVKVGTMVRDWVMQHELVLSDRRKRRMATVQVRPVSFLLPSSNMV